MPPPQEHANTTDTTGTISSNSNKPTLGEKVALLQTAQAVAMGENSQAEIQILLDSGSQLSCHQDTASKIEAKALKERETTIKHFWQLVF